MQSSGRGQQIAGMNKKKKITKNRCLVTQENTLFFRSHRKQIEMQTTQNCRCIGCRAGEKRGQWVGFGGSR